MNPTSRFPKVISLCLLLFPLLVTGAWAQQLEIRRVSAFNALTYGTAFTTGSANPAPGTQFSSIGITSSGVNNGYALPNAAPPLTATSSSTSGGVTTTVTLTTAQIGNSIQQWGGPLLPRGCDHAAAHHEGRRHRTRRILAEHSFAPRGDHQQFQHSHAAGRCER